MSPLDLISDEHADDEKIPENRVLLFGKGAQYWHNRFEGVSTVLDWDQPFGVIAVLDENAAADVFDRMSQHGKLAVPIADFTGGKCARCDFQALSLTAQSMHDAMIVTRPARMVLQALPWVFRNDDYYPLSVLALAKSRNSTIEARLDATSKDMVQYPLLGGIPNLRQTLEMLAAAKVLKRQFFERTQTCGHCGSARLLAREVCPSCAHADLREEMLVHHYSCGHQGVKSSFKHGQDLICPKCEKSLSHFGVDYDTPGQVFVCNGCGETAAEPDVSFRCGDCHKTTRGEDVVTRDWHHYELTATAESALIEGRLPGAGMEAMIDSMTGRRTPRDLAMMIDLSHRISQRYKRAFSLVLIDTQVSEGDMEKVGYGAIGKVQKFIIDLLGETIRETDFLCSFDKRLVVLLPETVPENGRILVDRLNEKIAEMLNGEALLTAEIVEDEKILAIINMLSTG